MTDNNLLADLDNGNGDIDTNKTYLEQLVGENAKFKTPEDLAKGKWESDRHIDMLQRKFDELRADYIKVTEDNQTKAQLTELIDQFKAAQTSLPNTKQPLGEEVKDTLDPNKLRDLVFNQVQQLRTQEKETDNYKQVMGKLKEKYGNNAANVLKQHIEDLDLTEDYVNGLARKSPKAFFKTLGLEEQQVNPNDQFQAPPRSQQRNDSFAPTSKQKRTWSYYQEMKKTNPKLYYDPKINVQMLKDAEDLGAAFADGDFN